MSEPTYRIDLERRPGDFLLRYKCTITRAGDGGYEHSDYAMSRRGALRSARRWIARQPHITTERLYATEDGRILTPAPVPQSLRVAP